MQIILLRHGRSLADDEKKFEGRYDSPLTDVGREQAQIRAQLWRAEGKSFDRVIASSLKRANETADIVGKMLNAPVVIDEDWMEMDNGDLAGLTYEEGKAKYPMASFINPFSRIVDTGESAYQLHGRAMIATENLMQNGDGSYLVVAHGGILNAAIKVILGIPLAINRSGTHFALRDLGFIELWYDPGIHRWTVVRFEPGQQA